VPRVAALILIAASVVRVDAQQTRPDTARTVRLPAVTVTATRTPTSVANVPVPVAVIDSADVAAKQALTVADLFLELPGLDATGVGTNQRRPSIRGLRGQRILLLEDGLRLNNARRQQDFGELPALIDINDVSKVEVVRGPASVLYGTDAMGGAVNVITAHPPTGGTGDVHGRVGYRYSSASNQSSPVVSVSQSAGRLAYRVNATWRETDSYEAPSGRFGNISLADAVRVNDTGVRDNALSAMLTFDLTPSQRLSARAEHYRARDAGFGYVDPALLSENETLVRITYPNQQVQKYVLGYRANAIGGWWADRVDVSAYTLRNERDLLFDIDIDFGPDAPPGAGLTINTANWTDLSTTGVRAEAVKLIGTRNLVTYGFDVFRDRSENTDSSVIVMTGFGPPMREESTRPQVPNASFRSAGVFVQDQIMVTDRLSLIAGVRAQDVRAETRATPGIDDPLVDSRDRTVVGAANALFRATESVSLIASVGRGFRTPNLVERFFDGLVPEGNGYQRRSPDLEPEHSVNVDVGVRVARGRLDGEVFVFRNEISDGISTQPTGETVNGVPEFRSINVEKLRFTGGEARASVAITSSLSVSGNYSQLDSKNVRNPDDPVGDGYASKLVGDLSYRSPGGGWWASYVVRHNGEHDDAAIGESPIGAVLPAFTVHTLRAGAAMAVRGRVRHGVVFAVENLTDELYAEFSNASFFRPEAGRSYILSYVVSF
jgi:outer membrane receptor protein involved in Fe transport